MKNSKLGKATSTVVGVHVHDTCGLAEYFAFAPFNFD